MKVSVIIITYNRKKDLKECINSIRKQNKKPDEIIVVDNNSGDNTEEIFKRKENLDIKYFKLKENLGVAGGRNFGIKKAKGEILVFIDDDALLEPNDALNKIIKKFEENKDIGVLTFQVKNFFTKNILREEFPHKNKSLNPNTEFETTYFIGAGHAIRKEVLEKTGLYPEDYFYGMEELDLSFRILDEGYKILYYPKVIVWHKKSPKGRISDNKKWIYMLRNRMCLSFKYLKWKHFLASSFIWSIKVIKESKNPLVPIKGIKSFLKCKKGIKRKPLKEKTLNKIKELDGRLWY